MKKNKVQKIKGQSALYDFLLFVPILLLAIVVVLYTFNTNFSSVNSNNTSLQYAYETLNSFLKSTTNYTFYKTTSGALVYQRDISGQNLILLNMYLLTAGSGGVDQSSLSPTIANSIEYSINITIFNMTHQMYYYYITYNTTSDGTSAAVTLGYVPPQSSMVYTASRYIPYDYPQEGVALVILGIWAEK